MPRLIPLSLVLILVACAPRGRGAPGANPTPAFGLTPEEDSVPSAVPTPGLETQWIEPDARNSVIFELPSPVRGQDVYWIQPNGEPPQKLINVSDGIEQIVASPDGEILAIRTSKLRGIHDETLMLLFLRRGIKTTIEENARITSVIWSTDSKTLIYTLWPRDGYMQVVGYNIDASEGRMIADFTDTGMWYVDGMVEPNTLLLSHLAGGGKLFDTIALLDMAGKEPAVIYRDPAKMLGGIALAPDRRKLAFYHAIEMGKPAELYILDLTSKEVELLLPAVTSYGAPLSMPVWSPDSAYLAVTMQDPTIAKGTNSPLRLATIKVDTKEISLITEVTSPSMLVSPFAWLSDRVLLVNNLGSEPLDTVLYSLHVDGTGAQKISTGRFLTTLK